jgi:hypothetical protein
MNPDDKSAVKEAAATLHQAAREGRQILEEMNDANRELAKSLRELGDIFRRPVAHPPTWRRTRWL